MTSKIIPDDCVIGWEADEQPEERIDPFRYIPMYVKEGLDGEVIFKDSEGKTVCKIINLKDDQTCTCKSQDLFNYGCKCGYLKNT